MKNQTATMSSRLTKTLFSLGLALLNATLLLGIMLGIIILLIFRQVDQLANTVLEITQAPSELIQQINDGTLISELNQLKTNIGQLNSALETPGNLDFTISLEALSTQLNDFEKGISGAAEQCAANLSGFAHDVLQSYFLPPGTRSL